VIPAASILLGTTPPVAVLAAVLALASFFRYAGRRYRSAEWAYR
jgi:hypothetical protein